MKRFLLLINILLITIAGWSQSVTINEAAGWLESAYVKWQPVEGAESYNVYYSGEGLTDEKIDDQLIRSYGTYCRADVLGLKAGNYTIKVAPVIEGVEGESTVSESVTVVAHDRTGFAFSDERVPGAYKADGTPKDDAVILYITQNTKNKVSLNVTGANENPCVGLQTILEGFKKGDDTRPLIIRMVGQITDPFYLDKGDIVIENSNNPNSYITLEGVGDDAVADGWGIRVKGASNIEIRNIGMMNCNSDEGDDLGLQQDNDHIWVHHCDFFYGDAGSDSDQAKGDGALDCKRSGYVTISYNHFWDTGKTNLLGMGEDPEYITYHHNWYDHSDSRHPRVRAHSVHVYNNYYDGISKYGVGATEASSIFVEANYFRHCKYPMLISMQGSDVFDEDTQSNDYVDMPTFSKENGGIIKAYNNYMTEERRFVSYGDEGFPNSTVDFDAYVASSRDETVGSSVVADKGGSSYNNFDTDASVMYDYTPDTPEDAKDKAISYAGRTNGGDFQWTFNNAVDDVSYEVNTDLKSALSNYETSLVSIQADSAATGGEDPGNPGDPEPGDVIHNFTLSGLSSTFYQINGNLSDSKGTVTYGDLTLTICLKMESSTSITFTTTEESTLTLVFNEGYSGNIKINDVSYTISGGILTVTIPADSYAISKDDVANLYYMSIDYLNGLKESLISRPVIFPNPVIDKINIISEVNLEKIEIYNLTGNLLSRIETNINSVDLSHLYPGNYLIKAYTNQGIYIRKVIKK